MLKLVNGYKRLGCIIVVCKQKQGGRNMKIKKVLALAVTVQMILATNTPIFAQDSNGSTLSPTIGETTTQNSSGGV